MRGSSDRGRSFDGRSGGRGGPPRGRGRGRGGGRGLSFSSRPRSSEGLSRGDRMERREVFPPRGRGISGRRSSPPSRRSPGPRSAGGPSSKSSGSSGTQGNQRSSPGAVAHLGTQASRYSPPPPSRRMSPPPRRQYSPPPRDSGRGGRSPVSGRDRFTGMSPPSREVRGGLSSGSRRDRYSDMSYSSNGMGRDSAPMRYSHDDLPPRDSRGSYGPPSMSSWQDRSRSPPPGPRYRSRSPIARRRSPGPAYGSSRGGGRGGRGGGRGRSSMGDYPPQHSKDYMRGPPSSDYPRSRDRLGSGGGGGLDYPPSRDRPYSSSQGLSSSGADYRGPKSRDFSSSRDRGYPPRDSRDVISGGGAGGGGGGAGGPRDRGEFGGGRRSDYSRSYSGGASGPSNSMRSDYKSYSPPLSSASYDSGYRSARNQRPYSPRGRY